MSLSLKIKKVKGKKTPCKVPLRKGRDAFRRVDFIGDGHSGKDIG